MSWLTDKIEQLSEEKDIEGLRNLRNDIESGAIHPDDEAPTTLTLKKELTL